MRPPPNGASHVNCRGLVFQVSPPGMVIFSDLRSMTSWVASSRLPSRKPSSARWPWTAVRLIRAGLKINALARRISTRDGPAAAFIWIAPRRIDSTRPDSSSSLARITRSASPLAVAMRSRSRSRHCRSAGAWKTTPARSSTGSLTDPNRSQSATRLFMSISRTSATSSPPSARTRSGRRATSGHLPQDTTSAARSTRLSPSAVNVIRHAASTAVNSARNGSPSTGTTGGNSAAGAASVNTRKNPAVTKADSPSFPRSARERTACDALRRRARRGTREAGNPLRILGPNALTPCPSPASRARGVLVERRQGVLAGRLGQCLIVERSAGSCWAFAG